MPPGRDMLSTKPAPAGSTTLTNTIGKVRVADNNGPRTAAPATKMTSGASATIEKRDEFSPGHSMTSSASASRVGGTSRSSVLAVLRLITKSNLVGCTIGRSAGFSPFRMRPV